MKSRVGEEGEEGSRETESSCKEQWTHQVGSSLFSLDGYPLTAVGLVRRARKKRASEDSDEDEAGSGTGGEDSDVEMADVNAHRKSDASEAEKQTRASRLSARTRAKVLTSKENGDKLTDLQFAGETFQWER